MPSPEGDHIMDSAFIHQAANELVQNPSQSGAGEVAGIASFGIRSTTLSRPAPCVY